MKNSTQSSKYLGKFWLDSTAYFVLQILSGAQLLENWLKSSTLILTCEGRGTLLSTHGPLLIKSTHKCTVYMYIG